MEKLAHRVIDWSFCLLFFLIPLVFFSGSFELFEYNKMMVTYALTTVIIAAWLVKIIASGVNLAKPWKLVPPNPFNLPIALYLVAHIISTVTSIDPHVSIWGYYSRFHEGLLATICYVSLFYAAITNLTKTSVQKIIVSSFGAAAIVALWGIAEHFGASPSCLFITKQLNNSCWIQDVTNRVFATLGQPNWMAAYLDIIILVLIGYSLDLKKSGATTRKFIVLLFLAFIALLFTKSRSGLVGLATGGLVFIGTYGFSRALVPLISALIIGTAIFGLPLPHLDKFSLSTLVNSQTAGSKKSVDTTTPDFFISESGDIRKIVWEGAVRVWQRYPLFGSGVETFAYSYYLDRPVEHNLVSEWDFLYNKAHNEFLNILATTGTVGMLAFLYLIISYCFWVIKSLLVSKSPPSTVILGLFAAYISLLVTNFFGFSVVIIGLFFFLIPAFSWVLNDTQNHEISQANKGLTTSRLLAIGLTITIAAVILSRLYGMWQADKNYAYGRNLNGINDYVSGYPYLLSAVSANPNEPTFRDELSYSEAVLASLIFRTVSQSEATPAANFSMETVLPRVNLSGNQLVAAAISDSNTVVQYSPNSMPFWKTRTKLFYQLATIDPKYLKEALVAIQTAAKLAPSDAKVHYNLAIVLSQLGQIPDAITVLEQTIKMKPNYREARFQLGLSYELVGQRTKARAQMEEILKRDTKDSEAQKWLNDHPAN